MVGFRTLEILVGILSTIGCVAVILTYIKFPPLRVFSGKISLFLSIAGIGSASCLFMGSPADESIECQIQGFFYTFFANVTLTTTSYISWVMLKIFYHGFPARGKVDVSFPKTLAIWGIPFLLATLPLFFHEYKFHSHVRMCWIHASREARLTAIILQFVSFYIPLTIALVFNTAAYYALAKRRYQETSTNAADSHSGFIRQALGQVMWYPVILICTYLFAISFKIIELTVTSHKWIMRLMVISGLHGLLFAAAYFSIPTVRHHWYSLFLRITSERIELHDVNQTLIDAAPEDEGGVLPHYTQAQARVLSSESGDKHTIYGPKDSTFLLSIGGRPPLPPPSSSSARSRSVSSERNRESYPPQSSSLYAPPSLNASRSASPAPAPHSSTPRIQSVERGSEVSSSSEVSAGGATGSDREEGANELGGLRQLQSLSDIGDEEDENMRRRMISKDSSGSFDTFPPSMSMLYE